jgi:hypothetical protein
VAGPGSRAEASPRFWLIVMLEGNAARALSATAANPKTIWCDISARSSRRSFVPRFEFRRGPFWNIRFARTVICGGRDGPATFWNYSCRGAQRAVRRNVPQRSIGPRAGHLLAGAGALRHAARLPKALRGLHGNGLLDRDAGAKVRIREALRGRRPTATALRSVSRFRSSHHCAAASSANFGIEGH